MLIMLCSFASLGAFLLLCYPAMVVGQCPGGWLLFNNTDADSDSCYFINNTQRSLEETNAFCESMSSKMFSLHSEDEELFVKSITPHNRYWMGLNKTRMGYSWSDGSPYEYNNWLFENCDKDCCSIYWGHDGWSLLHCGARAGAICEQISGSNSTSSGPVYSSLFWMMSLGFYFSCNF